LQSLIAKRIVTVVRFPWSRNKSANASTPPDWIERHLWVTWEAPRNYVAGEASYLPALTSLAGSPCEDGYCIPTPVDLAREPTNPYDPNAIRAEVRHTHVGYLRRHLAAQLAPVLDDADAARITVCGLIRGGSMTAPNLGCHIWLNRSLTPGVVVELTDEEYAVPWPPRERELFGS
jgi:hypothetical protein